jgi:hypothetical protein
VGQEPPHTDGKNKMAYQTVNPYDNQIVASFEELTDEQVTKLLA